MTTFRSFVDALEALEVTGVKRAFQRGPPKDLSAGEDLPAMYVRLPRGDKTPLVFDGFDGWTAFVADIVICVQAVGQGEEEYINFDDTVDMMDNLSSALASVTACDVISKTKHTWAIRQTVNAVAEIDYWAVIATVTGRG